MLFRDSVRVFQANGLRTTMKLAATSIRIQSYRVETAFQRNRKKDFQRYKQAIEKCLA